MTSSKTTQYIAVMEGEEPGTSRPILATADPATVAAVVKVIRDRLGLSIDPVAPLTPGDANEEGRPPGVSSAS